MPPPGPLHSNNLMTAEKDVQRALRATTNASRLVEICRCAVLKHGGDPATADSLAASAVYAERNGKPNQGITHLFDYLDALRDGRIKGRPRPSITRPTPVTFVADGDGGVPHIAFDLAVDQLAAAVRNFGVAVFSQKNAYFCGALGYFVERMASHGLIALATANSSALMSAGGSASAVLGTNPMAFAAPVAERSPLVIDQASSQTAFMNVRESARLGRSIPPGWALDHEGAPTTDAEAALDGVLLPFGGYKGSNIALMIEILSAMSGGNWSLDASPFDSGDSGPSVGMFLVCLDPNLFDANFSTRLSLHLDRLRDDFDVRLPGGGRTSRPFPSTCDLPVQVFERLWARAG